MFYRKLRAALAERGIRQYELAHYLHMVPGALSRRFTAQLSWSDVEMYAVMDFLGLPHDQLHMYFPPGGKAQDAIEAYRRAGNEA